MILRIGSRGSRLALTQAELAAERLRGDGVEIALVPITTAGDKDRTKPFGNIGSRLRKRRERGLDAVVLAACGLDRLGLGEEIGHRFAAAELLPEAGQGALALQVRAGEAGLVGSADHPETRRRVEAERACVFAIGGGCLAPVAAHHDGEQVSALVAAEGGSWLERASGGDPAELVRELLSFAPGCPA